MRLFQDMRREKVNNLYDSRVHLYVLHLIKNRGDISKIVGSDFDYRDVAKIITLLKSNGKISSLDGELKFTSEGELYYKKLLKEVSHLNKGPVILPQFPLQFDDYVVSLL